MFSHLCIFFECIVLLGRQEAERWWAKHVGDFTKVGFTEIDIETVQELTGNIPILLFGLARLIEQHLGAVNASAQAASSSSGPFPLQFEPAEAAVVFLDQLTKLDTDSPSPVAQFLDLQRFALRKLITDSWFTDPAHTCDNTALQGFIGACLTETQTREALSSTLVFDWRFLWVDSNRAYCSNGIARAVLHEAISEVTKDHGRRTFVARITRELHVLRDRNTNSSVAGFLAESVVLQSLSKNPVRLFDRPVKDRHGNQYPQFEFKADDVIPFDRAALHAALDDTQAFVLYTPRDWNYRAIDAFVRILPDKIAHAETRRLWSHDGKPLPPLMVPIQITLRSAESHKESLGKFFPRVTRHSAHTPASRV